ncbi:MAG: hypothetical protein J6I45_01735 [Clostridia bacterium]|nr:hypothetical protein [Clostridia bacterium]
MKKKFKFLCAILSLAMVLCTSTFAGGGSETINGVTFTYGTGGTWGTSHAYTNSTIVGYLTVNTSMMFAKDGPDGNVSETYRSSASNSVDGFSCPANVDAPDDYYAFSGDSSHSAYVTQVGYWGANSDYEYDETYAIRMSSSSTFISTEY